MVTGNGDLGPNTVTAASYRQNMGHIFSTFHVLSHGKWKKYENGRKWKIGDTRLALRSLSAYDYVQQLRWGSPGFTSEYPSLSGAWQADDQTLSRTRTTAERIGTSAGSDRQQARTAPAWGPTGGGQRRQNSGGRLLGWVTVTLTLSYRESTVKRDDASDHWSRVNSPS